MNIQIRSHEGALQLVQDRPHHYDIAFITSPQTPFSVPGSQAILDQARQSLMLQFDDIDGPVLDLVPPTREQIEGLLDWASDKSNLVASCLAGVSRSSAAAVVIMASR